jgi:hypothetical protein
MTNIHEETVINAMALWFAQNHIKNDIALLSATGGMKNIKENYHDVESVFVIARKYEQFIRSEAPECDNHSYDSTTGTASVY